jgi:exodeoxyribonuclease VII small subunit
MMADPVSYEDARDELIAVVQRLETGGTSLQESIDLWERGEELAKICQRWLDGARARLDAVMDAPTADREGPHVDEAGSAGPAGGDPE